MMGGEIAEFMEKWPYFARSRNDERPIHKVELSGFWISETPVTNKHLLMLLAIKLPRKQLLP